MLSVASTTKIDSFRGEYGFLSNFYPCQIDYEGITYPTVEHAFQAAKCLEKDERIKMSKVKSPTVAKRLGRRVNLRSDWETVKLDIMKTILQNKFSDAKLGKLLKETGDRELVEGNKWHDNFWGKCSCARCSKKNAQNMLGKLITEVRNEL